MATPESQIAIIVHAAKPRYLSDPVLIKAITTQGQSQGPREVSLLSSVITTANNLPRPIADHALTTLPKLGVLPVPFVETGSQSFYWARLLARTLTSVGQELGGNYTSPNKIENGDPFHVFRWFFIDTCARLTALHLFPGAPLAQEQANADVVADAYCEASVVQAEQAPNDPASQELVA